MNTSATDPASPPPTSRGTSSDFPQHASHDNSHHFLLEQSPRELVRAISSEYSATASSKDNEQPRSTIDSYSSSPSSSSSSVIQHQNTPLSFLSQQGLSESFSHMNINSSVTPPEHVPYKPRSRVRELSAPLPCVPPSTPASAISHRSSFSLTHPNHPVASPSVLRHGSPIFSSPLTELSDSDEVEQDTAELSDSNSVEIISGHVVHPFVPGRKDVGNDSQNVPQISRPLSIVPSSGSADSSINTCLIAQQMADLPSSRLDEFSTSQSPTSQSLSQNSSSPSNTSVRGMLVGDVSIGSAISLSKSLLPSDAIPRPGHATDSCLSSDVLSLASANASYLDKPAREPQDIPEVKRSQETEDILRTPNVYINGLPPHFPDESLYLMTRDFGHVLSVRTFTRCVGEKMSGYGFVLFESIESAERCIETLRKYRNLHPSFSKQVHKIPGTPYASGTITLPPSSSLPSLTSQSSISTMSSFSSIGSNIVPLISSSSVKSLPSPIKKHAHHNEGSISTTSSSNFSGNDVKDLTFREKMERLKDDRSTNLYMEGLPLTIDDVSLAALVSPHKIISSRFFQTKLSNPPRMIAFVRLDTRAGAEEIIERLHGRVVRGWNDNGCRISVRFADTNDQRELRRSERLNRGEEEMINGHQLSMAHAALLNLRGAEAQARLSNSKFRQHSHIAHYDNRLPVVLSNPQSAGTFHAGSDAGSRDSFLRLSSFQNVHGGYGTHPGTSQQQCRHTPPFSLQSQTVFPHPTPAAADAFDSRVSLADTTSILKSNTLANLRQSFEGLSANLLDASQFPLLQQQSNLHQLELLRQMPTTGIDPTYALDSQNHDGAHLLMPSADIMTNEYHGPNLQVSSAHIRQGVHERQRSLSQAQQHVQSYGKGAIPEITGPVQICSSDEGRYTGHRGSNSELSSHLKHQYAVNQNLTSPESGCSSNFMRQGGDDRVVGSSTYHRAGLEESEVTLISPALTYASRTPSTLSPATPLFNTFGTPVSAPATVPRGKTCGREREHARLFRNEHRQ